MKGIIYILMTVFLSAFLLSGCGKSDSNCMTSTGDIILQQRPVTDFDSIDVRDYVNIILYQDSINSVTVEAGKNIIDGIRTDVIDRQLNISNINKCNWLRSYSKPINVYVHVKNLWKIYYEASGDIISDNTLTSDSLKVQIEGGCGTIDLWMNTKSGYFLQGMGTVTLKLHGICDICSVYSGDYGPYLGDELETGYCFITSRSSNDSYVRASQKLEATIQSIGNIYYTGNPDTVLTHIQGSGQVIPY